MKDPEREKKMTQGYDRSLRSTGSTGHGSHDRHDPSDHADDGGQFIAQGSGDLIDFHGLDRSQGIGEGVEGQGIDEGGESKRMRGTREGIAG